jgi:transcriptional regulator with GAF, ATPase, and Fis domain
MGGRVRIGTGVIGMVAARRQSLHVGNLGQQRAYAAAQRRQLVKAGRSSELGDTVPVPGLPNAESQIAIPLIIRDELVGVFSIESARRQRFDEHDRHLVSIVANQIASAIRNAQLYDERRRAADALQAANATLEARVAERTADLERELRVAQELLSDARSRVEGPLLGTSAAVRALRDAVAREASRPEPLLISGPPGSGKEAVAYAVHGASKRTGAFIFVSCPELHTPRHGASTEIPGPGLPCKDPLLASKLELASGGTLFLEAVHELPSSLHDALIEVLEAQEQARARGDRPTPDVHIIASTTREIGQVGRGGQVGQVGQGGSGGE